MLVDANILLFAFARFEELTWVDPLTESPGAR